MTQRLHTTIVVIGIDIGKNSFHVVGLDQGGAIVLRQKWSRGQVETRLANAPPCLIGMEACVGAHHLSRKARGRNDISRRASATGGYTPVCSQARALPFSPLPKTLISGCAKC